MLSMMLGDLYIFSLLLTTTQDRWVWLSHFTGNGIAGLTRLNSLSKVIQLVTTRAGNQIKVSKEPLPKGVRQAVTGA